MKRPVCLALLAVTFFALVQHSTAAPVLWPVFKGGNGHYYELIKTQTSWAQATIDAESRSYRGVKGYLVSITSPAENAFLIKKLIPRAKTGPLFQVWIGGYQPSVPDWAWTSGEPWSYSNWSSGQPNNDQGREHWLVLYVAPNPFGNIGEWGDAPEIADTEAYYIVEYESRPRWIQNRR